MHDREQHTQTLDRNTPRRLGEVKTPVVRVHEDAGVSQNGQRGFRDIVGGAVLIAIGLAYGGSVFTGNPGPFDYVFDLLGTFWIVKGIWKLAT